MNKNMNMNMNIVKNQTVSLTDHQKQLLEKYRLPDEYFILINTWLENSKQDFFLVLSDLLQVAENGLSIKRQELAKKQDYTNGLITPDETPEGITILEAKIKAAWTIATSLWQCVDDIMRNPKHYDINLNRSHVAYILKTKNLPVLEMFLWARPEYFNVGKASPFLKQIYWALGGVLGAILGLIGGFLGGLKEGLSQPHFYKLLFPFYAISGLIISWSYGAVLGAGLGYRTGRLLLSLKLVFECCYINPFCEPKGSRKRQDMDLLIEKRLFVIAKKLKKNK